MIRRRNDHSEPEHSRLRVWAHEVPEWSLDARAMWLLAGAGLIPALIVAGWPGVAFALGLAVTLVLLLSVEPLTGALLCLGALLAAYFVLGLGGLITSVGYLLLLGFLGLLWTLRGIRYEDRRAARVRSRDLR